MVKKHLVLALCALVVSLPSAFAHAAGITLAQTNGTSSDVYYTPATPIGFASGQSIIGVFRPDGSLLDLIYDSYGFECAEATHSVPPANGHVDISFDFDFGTCGVQGQNPYGIYTFVDTQDDGLDNLCIWSPMDSNGHMSPVPNLQDCIRRTGSTTTYVTYDWLPPDLISPAISSSADMTVAATSSAGIIISYLQPSATDDRDGVVPVSCVPQSGSLFPVGTTTVACSAHDKSDNIATSTFSVAVRPPPASRGPVVFVSITGNGGGSIFLQPKALSSPVPTLVPAILAPAAITLSIIAPPPALPGKALAVPPNITPSISVPLITAPQLHLPLLVPTILPPLQVHMP